MSELERPQRKIAILSEIKGPQKKIVILSKVEGPASARSNPKVNQHPNEPNPPDIIPPKFELLYLLNRTPWE